ncbi:MAG: hypothetical protein RSC95_07150 [Anaerovoracaceae bacterium]
MVKNIKTSKSSLQFLEYIDNLMDLHKEIDYFMPLILRSEKFGAFIPNLCSKTPLILRSEKFGASPVDDQQIMEKAGNEKCKNPLILPAKK